MSRRLREILPLLLLVLVAGSASAQSQIVPPSSRPTGSASTTALIEQLMDQFPKFEGVLEVRNGVLTLGSGMKAGARTGLEVELFRGGARDQAPPDRGSSRPCRGYARDDPAHPGPGGLSQASSPAGVEIKPGDWGVIWRLAATPPGELVAAP
jgi:hypothetical protein